MQKVRRSFSLFARSLLRRLKKVRSSGFTLSFRFKSSRYEGEVTYERSARLPLLRRFKPTAKGFLIGVLVIVVVLSGLAWIRQAKNAEPRFVSADIKHTASIDAKFTCDGENMSPAFEIDNLPKETKSLAIIIEDLDLDREAYKDYPYLAQMMVWNIPAETKVITQGVRPPGTIGRNIFGNFAYGGPCPPSGTDHSYSFTLYALDKESLTIDSEAGLAEVKKILNKNKITKKSLIVTYKR